MGHPLSPENLAFLATWLVALAVATLWQRQAQRERLAQLTSQHAFEQAQWQERCLQEGRVRDEALAARHEVEARERAMHARLGETQQQCSRLEERAARLAWVEEEAATLAARLQAAQGEMAGVTAQAATFQAMSEHRAAQVGSLSTEIAQLRQQAAQQQGQCTTLREHVANLVTQLELEKKQAQEKAAVERAHFNENLAVLRDAKERFTDSFKTLANDILTEKSQTFTQHNKNNMELVLKPLQTQLESFRQKVEEVYVNEGKDRSGLATQVKQLMDLNVRLSTEADNLTRALKGSTKVQGDWGEVVLERLLEESGMRANQDYQVQESHTREDGTRVRPDVVIRLPDHKTLIIDAKVSLLDYMTSVNAPSEDMRAAALRRHTEAVREHVKGLSQKDYQTLYGVKSLDFVLMFIPIEPAFMAAISTDAALWQRAWEKNVLLVSPSTLLFVLRTVAHLWRQEQQQQNAQDIAHRGAELYNKFVGFVDDLQSVGDRLNGAQESYEKAFKKLKSGRGNLVGQAEKLRALGVKPSKQLPIRLLESGAGESGDSAAEDNSLALAAHQ